MRQSTFVIAILAPLCCGTLGFAGILGGIGQNAAGTEGQALSNVLLGTLTDTPSEPLSNLSATINWGDGTASAGILTALSPGQFDVLGSHTYLEEGNYSTSILASSTGGSTTTLTGTALIADAPLTGTSLPIFSTEGSAFSGQVASFQDANANAVVSDFAAMVNWGDGTVSAGTVVSNGTGSFVVNGAHTYAEEGTYSPTVSINDVGGASTSAANAPAIILDAPISALFSPATFVQNLAANNPVATFLDANLMGLLSDFTALIDWGDGTPTSLGAIVSLGNGQFQVEGQHTYSASGAFNANVSIRDIGGSTTQAAGSVIVNATPEPRSFVFSAFGLVLFAGLLLRRSGLCAPHTGSTPGSPSN